MAAITRIEGRALPLRGDDIDTDRIIPGRFLKSVTFDGLEQHVFEDARKAGGHPYNRHPFDVSHYQGASILIVNANFGCGSSREHAPQALYRWGIEAIIGQSFSGIFFGNSTMIGMPCVTASAEDVEALMAAVEKNPAAPLCIDLEAGTCEMNGVRYQVTLPPSARDAFLTGAWDTTGMLLERYDEVDGASARLPYITGF